MVTIVKIKVFNLVIRIRRAFSKKNLSAVWIPVEITGRYCYNCNYNIFNKFFKRTTKFMEVIIKFQITSKYT